MNTSPKNTSKSSFEKILANSSLTITLKSNDEQNMSKQITTIDNTKEVVSTCIEIPGPNKFIVKTELIDDDVARVLMVPIDGIDKSTSNKYYPDTVNPATMPVSKAVIKTEPYNGDMHDSLQTQFEQTFDSTPTARQDITTNPVLNCDTDLKQKLQKITANSSLSISLEPIEKTNQFKLSKEIFSNTSTSTAINYLPSVTLQPNFNHSLPSTSSSSDNNTSQSRSTQSVTPELGKISNCVSLKSIIDFEKNKWVDSGFIREISENICLPNSLWQHIHNAKNNSTGFIQRDSNCQTSKKVIFENSLMPIIHINGKEYSYNKNINSRNELQNLIDKLDSIEICAGYDGFISENCIGYYEDSQDDTEMCSACQDLVKIPKVDTSKSNTNSRIESLRNKVS